MGPAVNAWWRRNGIALLVLAVLVPVGGIGISQHERTALAGSGSDAVTAGPSGSVDVAGITVGPATAEFERMDSAPRGTRVVTVHLPVDTHGDDMSCLSPVLRETDGLQRTWRESALELGLDSFDAARPTSCPADAGRWFTLVTSYLVPADATGPFHVDLTWADALPEFARLRVEP